MALSDGSRRASGAPDLRLVLLGQPGSGKTTTANAILGRHAFEEQETTRSSVQTSYVGERSVSLIDTPRSLMVSSSSYDRPSGDELERCLSMAAPGPHAFLLVVPLGKPLSEGDVRAVEWIKQRLGEEALRTTVILFTGREKVSRRKWDHFLSQHEVQGLIRSCGGGYHTVNSKAEREPCHLIKLLEKIDAVVERSGGELYATDKFLEAQREVKVEEEEEGRQRQDQERNRQERGTRRKSITPPPEMSLTVVLLGKTGSGKSASGNTILGRKAFKEAVSFESVTEKCCNHHTVVDGRHIAVIDTPGLFGTEQPTKELKVELEKCVEMSDTGPHAFLLVISLDVRYTEEERNAVKWIQENFGDGMLKYTIMLLTHGDVLKGISLEAFLLKNPHLSPLTRHVGNRYHVFNNKSEDSTQVRDLLKKIEAMVEKNGGTNYTSEMYKEVQREIKENERIREEEERNRKQEAERELEEERRKREEAEMTAEEERRKRVEVEERAEEEKKRVEEEMKREIKEKEREREEEERNRKQEAERELKEEKRKRQESEMKAEEERRKRVEAEDAVGLVLAASGLVGAVGAAIIVGLLHR